MSVVNWELSVGHPMRSVSRCRFAVVIAGLLGGVLESSRAVGWIATLPNTADGGVQYARTVALDDDGDVIVAGSIRTASGFQNRRWFMVCKLSATDGSILWCVPDTETSNGIAGNAEAVAVSSTGEVFAAGGRDVAGTTRFEVLRIAAQDGTIVWTYSPKGMDGLEEMQGYARAIAIAADGAVVAAGSADGTDPERHGGFVVVRLNQEDGRDLWPPRFVAEVGRRLTIVPAARAVAVDAQGNAVAAGFSNANRRATRQHFLIAKLQSADGSIAWERTVDGTARREQLVVGPTLQRIATTSLEIADALMIAEPSVGEQADAIQIDSHGDAIAAGYVANAGSRRDAAIVKFDGATGNIDWSRMIDGGGRGIDQAFALTVDRANDVIAAGSVQASSSPAQELAVIKLAGDSGSLRWQRMIHGSFVAPQLAFNRAFAVTVDASGDVIVVGVTTNRGTLRDLTLAKLAGPDGTVQWCRVYDGGPGPLFTGDLGLAVAVDQQGDVIAAGSLNSKFVVLKLDGRTGADFGRSSDRRGAPCPLR